MEILKKQVDKFYINNKEFDTEKEADRAIRISDLKRLVRPYMKDTYLDMNNALEDIFTAILDNKDKAIDIVERPF